MATKSDNQNSDMIGYTTKKKFWGYLESPIIVHGFLAIGVFLFITPIIWEFLTALKSPQEIFTLTYIPKNPSLDSFRYVLIESGYWKAIRNSFIISSITTIITLGLGTPAAYIFSRYRFRFDNAIFLLVIGARLFPPVGLITPYFKIISELNLLNTKAGVIIANVYLWLPLVIYMMRNFFMSIPKDIDESARIDGCTEFQAFRKIVFPLALPGFAASAILTFLYSWREFLFGLVVSRDLQAQPISVAVFRFITDVNIQWTYLAAASVLAMLPTILIVVFFQRYIVQGLTGGAVKG